MLCIIHVWVYMSAQKEHWFELCCTMYYIHKLHILYTIVMYMHGGPLQDI